MGGRSTNSAGAGGGGFVAPAPKRSTPARTNSLHNTCYLCSTRYSQPRAYCQIADAADIIASELGPRLDRHREPRRTSSHDAVTVEQELADNLAHAGCNHLLVRFSDIVVVFL